MYNMFYNFGTHYTSITAEPNCLVPENNCIFYLETIHLITCNYKYLFFLNPHPSGRAVYGVGLRQLAFWYCGFESCRGHGCLSVVCVVCCSGRGPCKRVAHSTGEVLQIVACLSMIEKPQWGGIGPLGLSSHGKNNSSMVIVILHKVNKRDARWRSLASLGNFRNYK
jgi:hypothetical protein